MTYPYQLHYSKWHSGDRCHVEEMIARTRIQLESLLPEAPGIAVDVGCGMGFCVMALQQLGWRAEGIDIDQSQIDAATSLGASAVQVQDTAAWLEDRAGRYDAVLMMDVLEHIPSGDDGRVLAAARRSLKEGGSLLLTVPNANSPIAPRWRYIDYTHCRSFTESSLAFLLRGNGFTDIDLRWSPIPRRPSLRLWRKPAWHELRRWLVRKAWQQVLVAELGAEGKDLPIELNLTCVARA